MSPNRTEKPAVVVVLGHVDHGKSSLLDYIRESNVVASEAGGITQHTAAYEVLHKPAEGEPKRITFIDTPGHEAFQAQRERGATLADVAILVVSAEDGVKAQTKEAVRAIVASKIPYIVAINKMDLPGANIEMTLNSLAENEIYVEGRGGSISYVPVSAKTGAGVPDLLELITLTAELQELTGNPEAPAEGIVVESHRDPQKGVSATIIIKDGTLSKGDFIASEGAWTPVRAITDSTGASVENATFSSPVTIVGWSDLPPSGAAFTALPSKKEAEAFAQETAGAGHTLAPVSLDEDSDIALIPIIIKSDVAGSLDAVEHEIGKLSDERVVFKVLHRDVGAVSENDVKRAGGDARTVIVGFSTKVESGAQELAERSSISIITDTIIYKLAEQLEAIRDTRRPKRLEEDEHGSIKVLKVFSKAGTKQVVGGRVDNGSLKHGDTVNILRRGETIGSGKVIELQAGKQKTSEVLAGNEFGTKIDSTTDIAAGDHLTAFTMVAR